MRVCSIVPHYSTLQWQQRNCWTVPKGVRCSSLVLSIKRKCTPNSRCNASASYLTTSRPLHFIGHASPLRIEGTTRR